MDLAIFVLLRSILYPTNVVFKEANVNIFKQLFNIVVLKTTHKNKISFVKYKNSLAL